METVKVEAVTESSAKEYQLKWTIEDFSFACPNDGTVRSEIDFQFRFNNDSVKTKIQLYSKDTMYASIDFTELKDSILMKWEFILFNTRFEKLTVAGASCAVSCKQGYATGWKKLISWDDLLKGISHDDKLILICNVKASTSNYKPKIMRFYSNKILDLQPCIENDFAKLRRHGDFSDMTISVKGKEFPVHKNILAARSPVFAAMFKHEMKEAKSSKVKIEDIEPKVFDYFLDFIYNGKAKVDENAWELLPVADKYNVLDLKAICEDFLANNITKENCFKTLVLGDRHSAQKLKETTMNFIVTNAIKIDKSQLAQFDDPSLILELMKVFMNRK